MALWTTLTAVDQATGGNATSSIVDTVSGWFGGGGSVDRFTGELCPGQPPTEDVELMLSRATRSEISRLDSLYGKFNRGESFGGDAGQVAFAAMGGSDCVYSNPDKSLQEYFFELMDKYVYEYSENPWSSFSLPWGGDDSSGFPTAQSPTSTILAWFVPLLVLGLAVYLLVRWIS